jgi:hypothetical protein
MNRYKKGMTVQVAASGHPKSNTRVAPLILYVSVDLNRLLSDGKGYRWPRPRRCPSCSGRRLWSHGYAARYFDLVQEAVWVKRWRCPDCGAVHTARPSTHWRGFWATRKTILRCLRQRLAGKPSLAGIGRQRQQYWMHGLRIQRARASVAAGLEELLAVPILAATHSLTHYEIRLFKEGLHRIFAFTPPSG